MAAKAFTLLTLALCVSASPVIVEERSLGSAIFDSPFSEYLRSWQDEPAAVPAAKGKSPKGKSKGKAAAPKASLPPVADDAPAQEQVPASAPKAAPKGKSSKGAGGFSASGGASSGSASAGGGLLSSLGSLGMMSSSDITKGSYECKNSAFLFARGTGEPGNMGYVVGPPLGTQLRKQFGNDILIQGVDYATTFSGAGATEMVKISKQLLAKCPNIKIVLGGYSQGAMQVHQALGQLGGDAGKIAAAVTFGDPYSTVGWGSGGIVGSVMGIGGSAAKGAGAAGATASGGGGSFNPENGLILCSTGDFVCGTVPNIGGGAKGAPPQTGGKGGSGHLSYSSDGSIEKAAAFITQKIGGGKTAAGARY